MATTTGTRGRAREYVKLGVRRVLYPRGLELVSSPFPGRVVATLRWLGIETVVDVGANIGQYATALRASGFAGDIVSVEPLSDAFGHLSRRSARDPRWRVAREAVGAEPGRRAMNVAANSYASSLLPMGELASADPDAAFVRTEVVDVTTVAELVDRFGIDPARTLLKIDTQGYESVVLDGAGPLLNCFTAVQLELSFVALYDGQALIDDMTARMRSSGFVVFGLEAGFSDPRTGRLLQCDGLFVRSENCHEASEANV